jgi:hypothetical protein
MISLLPITKVITAIAVNYGVTVGIILFIVTDSSTSLSESIALALKGSAALNLLLLAFFYLGWRKLWNWFPSLNRLFFPDLNGQWDMEIHWNWGNKNGVAKAKAFIKQSFISISMEVESEDSDSETLLAKPKKDSESGRAILYYIYRNIPKKKNGNNNSAYEGTAILKLDHLDLNILKGNYYTNSNSYGHYEIRKTNI